MPNNWQFEKFKQAIATSYEAPKFCFTQQDILLAKANCLSPSLQVKYFHQLRERQKVINELFSLLCAKMEEITQSESSIIQEIKNYYKDLFSFTMATDMSLLNFPKHIREQLIADPSIAEIINLIKQINSATQAIIKFNQEKLSTGNVAVPGYVNLPQFGEAYFQYLKIRPTSIQSQQAWLDPIHHAFKQKFFLTEMPVLMQKAIVDNFIKQQPNPLFANTIEPEATKQKHSFWHAPMRRT